ncbi:MAG: hypothetical protein JWL63_3506 [Rhodocyclales bacterium]|nr:hypothetical protein [Rhodocyclales bacterium]
MPPLTSIATRLLGSLILGQPVCRRNPDVSGKAHAAVETYHPTEEEVDASGPLAYSYFGA